MGKIYTYRMRLGDEKVEILCTSKVEAEKSRTNNERRGAVKSVSSITTKTTPYLIQI